MQSLPSEHKRFQFQSVPISFRSVPICSNLWQSLPSEHKRLQFQSISNQFQSVPIRGSHSPQSISGSSSNLFQFVPISSNLWQSISSEHKRLQFQSVPICGSHCHQSTSGSSSNQIPICSNQFQSVAVTPFRA